MRTFLSLLTIAGMFGLAYLYLQNSEGQERMAEGLLAAPSFDAILLTIILIIMGVFAGINSHTLTLVGWCCSIAVWFFLVLMYFVSNPLTATQTLILFLNGAVGKGLGWGVFFSSGNAK